jgi:hypothetical protein
MKGMLKTPGIPMWVTIYALIVFVVGSLGLMAMLGPAMEGMNSSMSISWGGRHFGLGLAAGVAVLLKNPNAYIAAFVGGVGRDLGDLIAHLGKSEPSIGVLVGIVVFLIAGVLGIMAAYKARSGRLRVSQTTAP